jgi:hypothetical protein
MSGRLGVAEQEPDEHHAAEEEHQSLPAGLAFLMRHYVETRPERPQITPSPDFFRIR